MANDERLAPGACALGAVGKKLTLLPKDVLAENHHSG
jgi:hypothetical protein